MEQQQPQQKGMSLDEFIHRKVQPVKMIVSLLNREMELNTDSEISFSRMEVDNVITTLEIFIEEYERVTSVRSPRLTVQRRSGQSGPNLIDSDSPSISKKPAIKAVA